jgi:hypothetical protein
MTNAAAAVHSPPQSATTLVNVRGDMTLLKPTASLVNKVA